MISLFLQRNVVYYYLRVHSVSTELPIQKLALSELLTFARQVQIHDDLKEWGGILMKIHSVIDDAEEKQRTKDPVKIWLDELRNLAYDLYEFTTEALRRNLLLEHEHEPSSSKVRKSIPACFNGLIMSSQSVKFNSVVRSKIKEMTMRLRDIGTQENHHGLIAITSLANEAGRGHNKEEIVQLLRDYLSTADAVYVIPIIGMGGVVKKTFTKSF